jgi:acyl carrier protein
MRIKGNPYARTLYVWNSVSAFFFFSNITPFHSHNTMQLVFDLKKKFKCRLKDTEWTLYKAIVIKENAVHQLDTNGSIQLLIYLDAQADIARAIKSKYLKESDIFSLDIDILDFVKPGELEQCLIKTDKELLEKIVNLLLTEMVTIQKPLLTVKE